MHTARSGVPCYNVPPTQNTALVHEFRCLYTHDILKKQKKWHDGSLKFHTFNRRVMVYDDVKNYIGDLHYRQDGAFGEGLELQLDRPVMVEVGEPIGQTSTDLKPILERGRAGKDSTAEGIIQERPIQRANFASTNGKAKSLLEVLGPSQGRIGRAKPSGQSPFEQRAALVQVKQGEPPTKRLKVTTGKDNAPTISQLAQQDDGHYDVPVKRNQLRCSPKLAVPKAKQIHANSVVVDLASDDDDALVELEPALGTKRVSLQVRMTGDHHSSTTQSCQAVSLGTGEDETCASIRKKSRKKVSKDTNSAAKPPKHQIRTSSKTTSHDRQFVLSDLPQSEMTTLRLQNQPTRQKLMYNALLPLSLRSNPVTLASSGSPTSIVSSQHMRRTTEDFLVAQNRETEPFVVDCMAKQIVDDNRDLDEADQVKQRSEHGVIPSVPERIEHHQSPLFCSQNASQRSILSPRIRDHDESFDLLHSEKSRGKKPPVNTTLYPQSQVLVISSSEPEPEDLFSDDEQPDQSSNRGISAPGKLLVISPASSPVNGPLISDENLVKSQDPAPSASSLLSSISPEPVTATDIPRSSINREEQTHASPLHSKVRVLATKGEGSVEVDNEAFAQDKLKRIRGDTETASPESAVIVATGDKLQHDISKQDTGAWSKLEAFLLFDKWPDAKAKDKPLYVRKPTATSVDTINFQTRRPLRDFEHDAIATDEQIVLSIDTDTTTNQNNAKPRRQLAAAAGTALSKSKKPLPRLMPGIQSAKSILRGNSTSNQGGS